jgi:hypothetical protein
MNDNEVKQNKAKWDRLMKTYVLVY